MYVGTLTRVHIVKGIGYSVKSLKEVVIINALTLWPNSVLVRNGVECRVHPLGSLYCCCALGFLKEGETDWGKEGGGGREGREEERGREERKGWREGRKGGRDTREKLGGSGRKGREREKGGCGEGREREKKRKWGV